MATDKHKAEGPTDFFDVDFDEDGNIVVWDDRTRAALEKILGADMEYVHPERDPKPLNGEGPILCG